MPSPAKRTIRGVQGDDWHELGFSWWVPDESGDLYIKNGAMVEIPDGLEVDDDKRYSVVPISSARMAFRAKASDEDALVELDESDGIDPDELENGRVLPELTTDQTDSLSSGYWDVEATSDGGEVKTLARGNYIFSEDVTR